MKSIRSIIHSILHRSRGLKYPSDELLALLQGGAKTKSTIVVNENTALQSTTVMACIRVISEGIASLPLHLYERLKEGGKRRAEEHPLYEILRYRPNPYMTSFEFFELCAFSLLLTGDFFAYIDIDKKGRITSLIPLSSKHMTIKKDEKGNLVYIYRSQALSETLEFPFVFHVRGATLDGIRGVSLIRYAKEAIGLSLATEEFGARYFENNASLGAVLETPGELSDAAYRRLQKQFSKYMGLSKAHQVAILEEGTKIKEIGISPEDSQFLETRKFQVEEIARVFRVPQHMIGHLERATFSNIEHLAIEFVTHTLRPWLVRIEQAIWRDLLLADEKKKYFVEFLVDHLLRGDIESRYKAYAVGRQNGWLSANDIREMENMNPIEGGDIYLVPLNMIPATTLVQSKSDNLRKKEERAVYPSTEKRRISQNFRGVLAREYEKVVTRIVKDIRKGVKKHLLRGTEQEFLDFLSSYFTEIEEYQIKKIYPIAELFAREIEGATEKEIGKMVTIDNEKIIEYLKKHFSYRNSSYRGQLKSILASSKPEKRTEHLLKGAEEIDKRLSEWEEKEAEKFAFQESISMAGAFSIFSYMAAGIIRKLWRSYEPSCPYCSQLDGVVVDIDMPYIRKGERFQPEGALPLIPDVSVGHPPAHPGCDCMIEASL